MPNIFLENISFEYEDGTKALNDINLSIAPASKVAILGQNGAGKTSMVKLMNGLLRPSKGRVLLDDLDCKDYSTAKLSKKVSYVFQNPDDQIFHNKVIDELSFGPRNLGFSEDKVASLCQMALELCDLEKYKDENPYNLPYSLRKFVALACVLAMDCPILILDEPTAGQDKKGLDTLGKVLRELENMQKTVIVITHDMEFAAQHFSRIIVMANSKIISDTDAASTFRNEEIMKQARLKLPAFALLARELKLDESIIKKAELLKALL